MKALLYGCKAMLYMCKFREYLPEALTLQMNRKAETHFEGVCLHIVVIFVVSATRVIGTRELYTPVVGDVEHSDGVDDMSPLRSQTSPGLSSNG